MALIRCINSIGDITLELDTSNPITLQSGSNTIPKQNYLLRPFGNSGDTGSITIDGSTISLAYNTIAIVKPLSGSVTFNQGSLSSALLYPINVA